MINGQIRDKEVRISPNIDTNDLNTKVNNAKKFIAKGNKVKVTLRFRGREMAHQQLGLAQLQKIEADVTDFGVVEQAPKMEGRQMGMLLGPKKKK